MNTTIVSLRQNGVGPNKTCVDAILPEMVCGCDWSWCEVCNYCYKHCQCADEMEYAVVAATIDGWFLKKK